MGPLKYYWCNSGELSQQKAGKFQACDKVAGNWGNEEEPIKIVTNPPCAEINFEESPRIGAIWPPQYWGRSGQLGEQLISDLGTQENVGWCK